tara:strand:+ start:345 stop:668 length:324 start_codon:yes stop_codon:yes gene_type:complete
MEDKVSTFNERKDAFENKFAHEQDTRFKIEALRNKLLGTWAAEVRGLDEVKTEEYIRDVVRSDFQEAGDEDVFRKLRDDLEGLVDEQTIRTKMSECLQAAKDRISNS